VSTSQTPQQGDHIFNVIVLTLFQSRSTSTRLVPAGTLLMPPTLTTLATALATPQQDSTLPLNTVDASTSPTQLPKYLS